MPQQADRSVTIAASATASAGFGTGQATRGSFQLPSTFTGTAITFNVSNDGVTFVACPVEGNEAVTITVAASGSYSFPVKAFNFRYLQLVAGSSQASLCTITLFTRD